MYHEISIKYDIIYKNIFCLIFLFTKFPIILSKRIFFIKSLSVLTDILNYSDVNVPPTVHLSLFLISDSLLKERLPEKFATCHPADTFGNFTNKMAQKLNREILFSKFIVRN